MIKIMSIQEIFGIVCTLQICFVTNYICIPDYRTEISCQNRKEKQSVLIKTYL